MEVLSTKLVNMAEQKTHGLLSLLLNGLQCDLQQTTSYLSHGRKTGNMLAAFM